MAQVVIRVLLSVTVTVITLLCLPSTTEAEFLAHFCPNTTVFTPNSTFQSNLNHLFSTLSSNATRDTGFYMSTAGRSPNDTVYGLFLCRGDINATACKACVTTAIAEAVKRCPVEKLLMIWYDDCMLRYSNQSFFSVASEWPFLLMSNVQNVTTEPNRFNQVLAESMTEVATGAANGDDKFATKEANFTGLITLYSLGQCTQDLSGFDCNTCLREAIAQLPGCCGEKLGGRVLYPSCTVRFEVYPFYHQNLTSATAPAPADLPLPPPTSVRKGKSKISGLTIVAIAVPIAVSLVLFVIGYCLITKSIHNGDSNLGPKFKFGFKIQ